MQIFVISMQNRSNVEDIALNIEKWGVHYQHFLTIFVNLV
jgi:hypothetical protein